MNERYLTRHVVDWLKKEIETNKELLVKEKKYNTIIEIQAKIQTYNSTLFIVNKIVDDLTEDFKIVQQKALTSTGNSE